MMLARNVRIVCGCLALSLGGACVDKDDDVTVVNTVVDAAVDPSSTLDGAAPVADAGNIDGGFTNPLIDAALGDAAHGDGSLREAGTAANTSFFVTSQRSPTGNLGGLVGADARCQALAAVAGLRRKFRAFLSVERDPDNNGMPTHARDRIGSGPWYNARGVLIASDLTGLLALKGNVELFVDEYGQPINGQWAGSPRPNEHDILTGSDSEGRVMANLTCADWTSNSETLSAQVGHSDGLGPNMDTSMGRDSWLSAHANGGCHDTSPRGGAGRIYCFAVE